MQLDDESADVLLGDGSEERTPRDLVTSDVVFGVAFHPNAAVLAVGLVSGRIDVHQFRRNETRPIVSIPMHKAGISAMEFTRNGSHMASISSDRHIKIFDCTSQQTVIDIKKTGNPHKNGLSSLCVCTETTLAVGDDDGRISMWDMRLQKPVLTYFEHADIVSGLIFFEGNNHLISCSGDTTLGCYDVRANRVHRFSDKRKDELNCMAFLPATNNIVCGTPSGLLPIWKYGAWSRPYDVHGKHPKECEALIAYNDNIFFSGAFDGVVRVIQHNPVRRILTHLGGAAHKSYNTVTTMSISHDRTLFASAGNDKIVHFHDIEFLGNDEELDKLRGRAERAHLATIRKATAEDRQPDSSDWGSDSDSDSSGDKEDKDSDEEAEENDGFVASHRPMADNGEPLDRITKRQRMAASRWLKTAQKERINFTAETRKKRTKGFWGGLVDDV